MNRKLLLNLITEYCHSLTRVDGEREQMKTITDRAVAELGLDARHFRRVAVARHRDKMTAERDAMVEQIDLFDEVIDKPINGATVTFTVGHRPNEETSLNAR